jgi:hypothetical protein
MTSGAAKRGSDLSQGIQGGALFEAGPAQATLEGLLVASAPEY